MNDTQEKTIFLDNASTTQMYKEVSEIISKTNLENFYNPSAMYHKSVVVKDSIENAKSYIAQMLNVDPKSIIFTSGATEANNLAIMGSLTAKKGAEYIFSSGEHPSVYNVAKSLEQKGNIVHFVKLGNDGSVDLEHLKSLLNENTHFVSIMFVSNETGAINDIKTISSIIKSFNPKIIFHVDGVQAFCKIPCNLTKLGVDAFTISAHKFHGPKGVGLLYYKNLNQLKPQILGGGQQLGFRSGTENVSGILGMAKAVQLEQENIAQNYEKVKSFKQIFIDQIKNDLNGYNYHINGSFENSSPYILSVSFKGLRGEVLMHILEQKGVIVGTGSACSSKKQENRVLANMGQTLDYVKGNIRVSFSSTNTLEEIILASKILTESVKEHYESMSR